MDSRFCNVPGYFPWLVSSFVVFVQYWRRSSVERCMRVGDVKDLVRRGAE